MPGPSRKPGNISLESHEVLSPGLPCQQLPVRAACATDVGQLRKNNEDSCLVSLEQNLFIVSDGMGGRQAGEVASRAVVTMLPGIIERFAAGFGSSPHQTAERVLREAIQELNWHLRAEAASQAGLEGMGATVSLVWLRDSHGTAHLAHVGDSRIYLYRQGCLTQLTQDHSVASLLVQVGEITPREALRHPTRAQLTRYLGMQGEVHPDVGTVHLLEEDRLLLCTDGLVGLVSEERMTTLLLANAHPEAACRALVAAANEAGGTDNITVLVVDWG